MTHSLISSDPEDAGLRIRKATLADRDALIELMRVVFAETGAEKGPEVGPEFWDWQFARQPANRMEIWVGESHGQIVAQVPGNVVRVKWRERELLATWVIDLLVHPAHRDKSMFVRVGRAFNQEMAATGVGICLGLPNKRSMPASIRFLKYKLVNQVPVLVLPVRWGRLVGRAGIPTWASSLTGALAATGHRLTRLPTPRAKGIMVREVTGFPEGTDDLWQRAAAPHTLIPVRDRQYLNWRYCDCPTRKYRIHVAESDGKLVGYLVHRVFEKDGMKIGALMDVLVDPGQKNAVHALLGSGISALREQKVDAVMSLMQRDDFYYPALRRWGFVRVPERFNPRTFNFVCRILVPGLPEHELCAGENWFITLGDFDVY
jgi:hypothetical protein